MDKKLLKQQVCAAIDASAAQIKAIADCIADEPELGFKEVKTSAKVAEFMRELRKDNYSNIAEKYFKLGNNLNQRDAIAVRKLISGFIKLIYPDGEVSKDEVAEIMDISLELRRRVKEQLKKIGGMEFYDVNFSYIDNDSFDEHFNTGIYAVTYDQYKYKKGKWANVANMPFRFWKALSTKPKTDI